MKKSRVLSVLRHGEAELVSGNCRDFSRQLSPEGKHQISRLNEVLKNNGFEIQVLLSSPAKRASQTTELITRNFSPADVKFEEIIYEAEPEVLLKLIQNLDDNFDNLMVVGHNPGLSALVSYITGEGYVSLRPGMMAILDINVRDWSLIGRDSGVLREIWQ